MRLRSFFAVITVIFSLIISSLAIADDKRGFKGVYIGQSAAELPPSLKKDSIFYVGIHDNDFFRVTVMNDRVRFISIVYSGETFSRAAVRKAVTLAQALREHSLTQSPRPELALARDKDGRVWGLIDLTNKIAFSTFSPTSPDGVCSQVDYMLETAPVLRTSASSKLTDEQVLALMSAATSIQPPPSPVRVTQFEDRYIFSSREVAVQAIINQADVVIGKGKRVMALINSVEAWLQVDENHLEARGAFRDLRKFHSEYEKEYKILTQMYSSNKTKLSNDDVLIFSEPMTANERIQRRINQVSAMGFNRYAIDLP